MWASAHGVKIVCFKKIKRHSIAIFAQ